jgi:hypothetical protein
MRTKQVSSRAVKPPSYMGEHSGCRETSVNFFIAWDRFDPEEITRRFGVKPTKAWAEGDSYQSKAGPRVRATSMWRVESSNFIKSTSTEKHALKLLKILEPTRKAIRAFAKTNKGRIGISVYWEATDAEYGGFTLRSNTMRRLTSLCKEIDFRFVSSSPEQKGKQAAGRRPPWPVKGSPSQ